MSTATALALVAGTAAVTIAIKAVGPAALGGRPLPPALAAVIGVMAPALLTALVVTNALADEDRIAVGADTAGVAAAVVVIWRSGSLLGGVAVAVAVTAGLRALGT